MISVTRYHDISAGHRVVGHEGKCKNLHGHSYRIHFTLSCNDTQLDDVGRVLDFGIIKLLLCEWLEDNWDHKFLVWFKDPKRDALVAIDNTVVWTEFNPTAENMAMYLVKEIGPSLLSRHGATLTKCTVEETRKCSATYEI